MTDQAEKKASEIVFQVANRGRGQSIARMLSEEEHATVNSSLSKMGSKKAMIEFLVKRGWTDSQISQKIRYDDDKMDPITGKVFHRAGDPLRVQHVYNTRAQMKS